MLTWVKPLARTLALLQRHDGDGLPRGVEVQGRRPLLPSADARLLVAAERYLELEARRRQVDVHESCLRAGAELVGVAQRLRRYPSGQTVAGVVSEPDGI